jgi:hypothetical protein
MGLVAVVRNTGKTFEYLGAYYRPSRLDLCLPIGAVRPGLIPRFGVLTTEPRPESAEKFLEKYGKISDHELDVFAQQIAQANRQVQLMGVDAIAFAATAEFRETLDRHKQ